MKRSLAPVVAYAMTLLVALASLTGLAEAQGVLQAKRLFPHEKHAKLFPTCSGCHAGVQTGDEGKVMPPPGVCAECHNGTDARAVQYSGPAQGHDFLRFTHVAHATKVAAEGRECTACHGAGAAPPLLQVAHATPTSCLGCHAHRAQEHLAPDSRCERCHVPLVRSKSLTGEQISAFPTPASHAAEDFPIDHAVGRDDEIARCATCHARESCARCHVNAADVPAIARLAPDTRVAALMRGRAPVYLTPADHRSATWDVSHGAAASGNTARCASCHARPGCLLCHTGALGQDVIRRLPDGRSGAPGVRLALPSRRSASAPRRLSAAKVVPAGSAVGSLSALPHGAPTPAAQGFQRPVRAADTTTKVVRPHPVGFDRSHGPSASAGRLTCEGCHTKRFCSDCHSGESRRRFHVPNFVARHAPESYGRDQQCQACHNPEVFCRSCHQSSGLASRGERVGAFHNAQPQWLLQHGRAARQGLESCVTCHKQRDCMQCHATTGWGVSPHGPDFDARRVGARARVMCARCHITDPLTRR